MFLDYLNMVDNSTETKSSNLNARESRIIRNTMGDKTTEESGAIHRDPQGIINTGPGSEESTESPIHM